MIQPAQDRLNLWRAQLKGSEGEYRELCKRQIRYAKRDLENEVIP